MVIRFGEFSLDDQRETLIRKGTQRVVLQPLLFRLLTYLAQRPGELVTKEVLLRDVWVGSYSAGVITTAVGALRDALGDSDRTLITTVRSRGYRFEDRSRDRSAMRTDAPPIVGRERELEYFERILATDASFGLLLTGMAGIGKSALLRAYSQHAERRGYQTHLHFASHLAHDGAQVLLHGGRVYARSANDPFPRRV